jgi:hypothetical protein
VCVKFSAANPRLKKAVYWLVEARSRGRTLEQTIAEAQRINGNNGAHGALVRDSLIRNVTIADRLGCTTSDNLDLLRRGNSPIITRGPYRGEIAEVDHIIPVAISAELENEFANLELMPRSVNRRKGRKVSSRQVTLARSLREAGVLTPDGFVNVVRAGR